METVRINPVVVQKVAAGQRLTGAETAQVTKAVTTVVGALPVASADKAALTQTTKTEIKVVATASAPKAAAPAAAPAAPGALTPYQVQALAGSSSTITPGSVTLDNAIKMADSRATQVTGLNTELAKYKQAYAAEKDPAKQANLSKEINRVNFALAFVASLQERGKALVADLRAKILVAPAAAAPITNVSAPATPAVTAPAAIAPAATGSPQRGATANAEPIVTPKVTDPCLLGSSPAAIARRQQLEAQKQREQKAAKPAVVAPAKTAVVKPPASPVAKPTASPVMKPAAAPVMKPAMPVAIRQPVAPPPPRMCSGRPC